MSWQYLILIAVFIVIVIIVLKINKKDFSIEANKLIQYLGGKDNIIDVEVNMSRLKVILKGGLSRGEIALFQGAKKSCGGAYT